MTKLKENLSVGQFLLGFSGLIFAGLATFYGVTNQVTKNEVQIEMMVKDVDKVEHGQERLESDINRKLDRLIQNVNDIKVELERKEDRKNR